MIPRSYIQAYTAFALILVFFQQASFFVIKRTSSEISGTMLGKSQISSSEWKLRRLKRFAHRLNYNKHQRRAPMNQHEVLSESDDLDSFEDFDDYFVPAAVSVAKPSVAYHTEKPFEFNRKNFIYPDIPSGRISEPKTFSTKPNNLLTEYPDFSIRTSKPAPYDPSTITEEELIVARTKQPEPYWSILSKQNLPKLHVAETNSENKPSSEFEFYEPDELGSGDVDSAPTQVKTIPVLRPEVGPSVKTEILELKGVDESYGHFSRCGPQDANYCLNGGTCVVIEELLLQRICRCPSQFTGERCEELDTDGLIIELIELSLLERSSSGSPSNNMQLLCGFDAWRLGRDSDPGCAPDPFY